MKSEQHYLFFLSVLFIYSLGLTRDMTFQLVTCQYWSRWLQSFLGVKEKLATLFIFL